MEWSMRTSSILVVSAALLLAAEPAALLSPAHADPAYSSQAVVKLFTKEKSAKQFGASRKICLEGDPSCGQPPSAPKIFDLLVNFEFNSDHLTVSARENLSEFAKALLDPQLKGTKFEIDGHTDASGTEMYNMGLSERRAKSVVDYLASLGVDQETLVAHGFGKNKPRVPDPYSPQNRRVETHLMD
jgi:OOP family OmpA-OmpF porin